MARIETRAKTSLSSGFPPVARDDARLLILGSLPGARSIEAQQYYAQPRNAFWRIMGELVGAGPELGYARRLRQLEESAIALWDVAAAAERPGSLDTSIVPASVAPNDFGGFFEVHRRIGLICFNGAKAAELYRRLVIPGLDARFAAIPAERLPSTSPAHAGMPYAKKLQAWTRVAEHLQR
jgi:hypoxanthine-DNA glycosylase